mmetsp:Transcript_88185/g.276168  ORF Transcript_88185/g.276168 Transcript_88185/m.276168 type:complete len:106 (-) Transcript_88185:187-504(-)
MRVVVFVVVCGLLRAGSGVLGVESRLPFDLWRWLLVVVGMRASVVVLVVVCELLPADSVVVLVVASDVLRAGSSSGPSGLGVLGCEFRRCFGTLVVGLVAVVDFL